MNSPKLREQSTVDARTLRTSPPNLRKPPTTHPECFLAGRCETCATFGHIGFCIKYQTLVEGGDLCDGYESVLQGKKRIWAERGKAKTTAVGD